MSKDWREQFEQRIAELERDQQNFLNLIKDCIKRDAFDSHKIITWGEQMKRKNDNINLHRNMLQRFIKQTENE